MIDKYYEIEDIVKMLKLTRRTIYNYIKDGKLKAFKVGREWRITETALLEFLNGGQDNV